MNCEQARDMMLDDARSRLGAGDSAALRAHQASCAACSALAASERAVGDALEKLPQYAAPLALKHKLAAGWPVTEAKPRRLWRRALVPALSAAAAVLVVVVWSRTGDRRGEEALVAGEAVNDHLRILEGAPLSQVTGGLHEVKPWFAGKLDFAPAVLFAGDSEFPLAGGAIERFLDRRAAVFVYRRRLHSISLFVVRPESLALSETPRADSVRGFNVISWKKDAEGFVLVSDLNAAELHDLQRRLAR